MSIAPQVRWLLGSCLQQNKNEWYLDIQQLLLFRNTLDRILVSLTEAAQASTKGSTNKVIIPDCW
jgi:hypothetical protein